MSNIIYLFFSIQIGIMPLNGWYEYGNTEKVLQNNAFYINIDTEINITDYFFIGGNIDTYMVKNEIGHTFNPLQQTYEFRSGFRFGHLEIGYQHVCGPHPVFTYPQFYSDKKMAPFEGAYDKIYIQISNK